VVADVDLRNLRTGRDHYSRDLVAEYGRSRRDVVGGKQQIRVAQSGGLYADEDFAFHRCGDIDLLEIEALAECIEDKSFHVYVPFTHPDYQRPMGIRYPNSAVSAGAMKRLIDNRKRIYSRPFRLLRSLKESRPQEPNLSEHANISPAEAADRLAIRELIEAYAHCADRREAQNQMALFTVDTHYVVYMNAKDPKPSMELHSRAELAPVFADLNQYAATMHLLGQSTVLTLSENRATVEVYCMPHHLTVDGDSRKLMIAALRYHDTCVKIGGAWFFSERILYVDWQEHRNLG
jgi:hypothetical protein